MLIVESVTDKPVSSYLLFMKTILIQIDCNWINSGWTMPIHVFVSWQRSSPKPIARTETQKGTGTDRLALSQSLIALQGRQGKHEKLLFPSCGNVDGTLDKAIRIIIIMCYYSLSQTQGIQMLPCSERNVKMLSCCHSDCSYFPMSRVFRYGFQ